MILILYASMAGVDPNLTVAAKSLGATAWQLATVTVFFPVTKGTLVAGTLLVFVLALGAFLTPTVLGGPRNTTVRGVHPAEDQPLRLGHGLGHGHRAARHHHHRVHHSGTRIRCRGTDGTHAREPKGVSQVEPLGRSPMTVLLWIDFALVLLILLVPLIVVIPVSFTDTEFISFPPQGFTLSWYGEVLTDSLLDLGDLEEHQPGIGVAFLRHRAHALLLARAMLSIRSALTKSALQAFVYGPLVVPVILLAIELLGVQERINLLGTTWVCILAHTVLTPCRSRSRWSTTRWRGWILRSRRRRGRWGRPRTRTFFVVVLRPILPSIVGAMLLAFITSWDEVVIALFQTVDQQETLPITIFSFIKAGVQPSVAAVATLLIAIVLVVMVVSQVVGGRRHARPRRRRQDMNSVTAPIPLGMGLVNYWHVVGPFISRAGRASELPSAVDVAIVGGGFTGLWTALQLQRREPGLSVVVLEARAVGHGASGREANYLTSWFHHSPQGLLALGRDVARGIHHAAVGSVQEVLDVIREFGTDSDLQGGPVLLERIERVGRPEDRPGSGRHRRAGQPDVPGGLTRGPAQAHRVAGPGSRVRGHGGHAGQSGQAGVRGWPTRSFTAGGLVLCEQTPVLTVGPRTRMPSPCGRPPGP